MPNKSTTRIPGCDVENSGKPEQEKTEEKTVIHNGSGGAFEASEGRIEDVEEVREEKDRGHETDSAY